MREPKPRCGPHPHFATVNEEESPSRSVGSSAAHHPSPPSQISIMSFSDRGDKKALNKRTKRPMADKQTFLMHDWLVAHAQVWVPKPFAFQDHDDDDGLGEAMRESPTEEEELKALSRVAMKVKRTMEPSAPPAGASADNDEDDDDEDDDDDDDFEGSPPWGKRPEKTAASTSIAPTATVSKHGSEGTEGSMATAKQPATDKPKTPQPPMEGLRQRPLTPFKSDGGDATDSDDDFESPPTKFARLTDASSAAEPSSGGPGTAGGSTISVPGTTLSPTTPNAPLTLMAIYKAQLVDLPAHVHRVVAFASA